MAGSHLNILVGARPVIADRLDQVALRRSTLLVGHALARPSEQHLHAQSSVLRTGSADLRPCARAELVDEEDQVGGLHACSALSWFLLHAAVHASLQRKAAASRGSLQTCQACASTWGGTLLSGRAGWPERLCRTYWYTTKPCSPCTSRQATCAQLQPSGVQPAHCLHRRKARPRRCADVCEEQMCTA